MQNKLFGGIEAGGTKFICAVGTSATDISASLQVATTTPDETLGKVVDFFKQYSGLQSLGVASFGPLDLDKSSTQYGHILSTPKQGWENVDIAGILTTTLHIPVELDTDVNCAALGEQRHGAGRDLGSVAYVTVGTGIGIGLVVNGSIFRGISHTEMGHMAIPRQQGDDTFTSVCPYHTDCLEGLASGTAIAQRWGRAADGLDDINAWKMEAAYLATGIQNLIFCIMPDLIVVGGGVSQRPGLIDMIRQEVTLRLHGYITAAPIVDKMDSYIVTPELPGISGVCGAIELAINRYQ